MEGLDFVSKTIEWCRDYIVYPTSKMSTVEEIGALVTAKAEEIRSAKASGAGKDKLTPLVEELLGLKER